MACQEAARRIGWLRLSGPDCDDLARQAAADALTAITTQLDGFRGQSRFRTWASKFAMSGVSAAAGRRFWQTRTMSRDQEAWDRLSSGLQPDERAERSELLSALRRAVDEDLSGEQRTVFTAVTLHGVPAAALATALGSSRNAIYKALFEARCILRSRLAATGRDLAHRRGAPWTGPPWRMICSPQTRGCGVRSSVPRTGPLRRSRAQPNGPRKPVPGSGRAPAPLRSLPSGLPGVAGRRRRAARPARSRDDRDGGFCCPVRSARGLRPRGPHRPWS